MSSIGAQFYQATKYGAGTVTDFGPLPQSPLASVDLPKPRGRSALGKLLTGRRSRRKFTGEPISLGEFSFLLWAANGISAPGLASHFRTAPSAGARCPLDTYLVVLRVERLEKGIYLYRAQSHSIELVRKGDFETAAVKATAGQEWTRGSAFLFAWIAEFARTTSRYKDRGYRYVFLDAGHVCQNVYLAAESLGFGVTGIAALVDDEVNALVGVDGVKRSIVYMAALGKVPAQ